MYLYSCKYIDMDGNTVGRSLEILSGGGGRGGVLSHKKGICEPRLTNDFCDIKPFVFCLLIE